MIAVAFLLTMAGADAEWNALKRRIEDAPQPVRTFIERRAGCNHFWGEVGSDFQEREAQVQLRLKELRCGRLDVDERNLRYRYRKAPRIVRLLRETREIGPW